MQVEITGAPTLDRTYRGLPLRVPLNGSPDETWQACLSESVPREAIRLTRVDGESLLVFPSQEWQNRHTDVLDALVRAIGMANAKHFTLLRRRSEVSDSADQDRDDAAAQADDDLASWWDGRQGASA
jgi:hypothetical protein